MPGGRCPRCNARLTHASAFRGDRISLAIAIGRLSADLLHALGV